MTAKIYYCSLFFSKIDSNKKHSLRKKRPNMEFFLVRIFPYSDWIQRFTLKFSVFSTNGKYRPKKLRTLITQCTKSVKALNLLELSWDKFTNYIMTVAKVIAVNLEYWFTRGLKTRERKPNMKFVLFIVCSFRSNQR